MNRIAKGAMIAGAAAALVMAGTVGARAEQHKDGGEVHCAKVNECKGHGACSSAEHDCAGKNACKGQGFLKLTKEECAKRGGEVLKN